MHNIVFFEDKYIPNTFSVFTEAYLKNKYNDLNFFKLSDNISQIEASLKLQNFINTFPENSIFIFLINLKFSSDNTFLIFKQKDNKYIIMPNNGFIGYLDNVDLNNTEIYKVKKEFFTDFAALWKTIILIIERIYHNKITDICVKTNEYKRLKISSPQIQIDSFSSNILLSPVINPAASLLPPPSPAPIGIFL